MELDSNFMQDIVLKEVNVLFYQQSNSEDGQSHCMMQCGKSKQKVKVLNCIEGCTLNERR